jgi:REP element-mobilizing transposase RayT
MGHSFNNLLYHLIFATKQRQPWLTKELRPALFEEMGGILKGGDVLPLLVNGVEDHVHALVKLKPTHNVAKVVGDLKARSTGWVHRQHPELAYFFWQTGYGAFTVSQSQAPVVREYIATQEQHHQRRSLEMEFRELLLKNECEVPAELEWD